MEKSEKTIITVALIGLFALIIMAYFKVSDDQKEIDRLLKVNAEEVEHRENLEVAYNELYAKQKKATGPDCWTKKTWFNGGK